MAVIGRVPSVVAALALIAGSLVVATPESASPAVAAPGTAVGLGPAVVVRIDPSATSIEAVSGALGADVLDALPGLANTYLLASTSGESASALTADARALNGVRWAETDADADTPEVQAERIYRWSASDPVSADAQYAGTLLQLDEVHAAALGAGAVVAVIDSGVQLLPAPHPDLATRISETGVDFVDGDAVPDDEADGVDNDGNGLVDEGAGHGTHVAGIIHRVAPLATIMPVRVLDSDGGGNEWDVARGMLWAADNGADVVNLSLGMHGSASLLKETTQALVDRGVVVVAAAGNDGESRNEFPAASRCAIGVTGTSSTDAVSRFATRGSWVDVGAPAEDISSTFPFFPTGYATWTGTSMAAPFVAGEAALLRGVDPTLTTSDVMTYINGSTVPYAAASDNNGRGRVAPLAALQALAAHTRIDSKAVGVDQHCGPR